MNLVSKFALAGALIMTANSMTSTAMAEDGVPGLNEDPHIWLEDAYDETCLLYTSDAADD